MGMWKGARVSHHQSNWLFIPPFSLPEDRALRHRAQCDTDPQLKLLSRGNSCPGVGGAGSPSVNMWHHLLN